MWIEGSGELNFAITGDELQKETAKYAALLAPLDAILLPEDLLVGAHLQDHSMVSGMASITGVVVHVGEMRRAFVSDRGDGKG